MFLGKENNRTGYFNILAKLDSSALGQGF